MISMAILRALVLTLLAVLFAQGHAMRPVFGSQYVL